MMKAQIEKKYKEEINTLTLTDLSNIDLYNLDKFDFIVSSVDIKSNTKTPIVYVDIIFKQKDFDNIDDIINVDAMDEINKIFKNSIFIKDVEVNDMDHALDILSELASKDLDISKENIKKQYKKREKMAFTSYKNVAVPHILEQVDTESFSIILIPQKSVKWNDDDVKLIYSLFVGKEIGDMSFYYEKLSEFLNDDILIEKACNSKDKVEFMNVFLGGNK